MDLTVCILIYGDYPDLAQRALSTLLGSIPANTEVRVGLNEVSDATLDVVADRLDITLEDLLDAALGGTVVSSNGRTVRVYRHVENAFKYPVMREMFYQPPLQTEWMLWLDDDTWFQRTDWLDQFHAIINRAGALYAGEEWLFPFPPSYQRAVQKAAWYTGRAPRLNRKGEPHIAFFTGGFFFLAKRALYMLAWPDRRLKHNGGDTLLGEACYQAGIPRVKLPTKAAGVMVNAAKRRGYSEKAHITE